MSIEFWCLYECIMTMYGQCPIFLWYFFPVLFENFTIGKEEIFSLLLYINWVLMPLWVHYDIVWDILFCSRHGMVPSFLPIPINTQLLLNKQEEGLTAGGPAGQLDGSSLCIIIPLTIQKLYYSSIGLVLCRATAPLFWAITVIIPGVDPLSQYRWL